MSHKLINRIKHEVDLPHPELVVLESMAENAKDDGSSCRPSVDLIAWRANYKPRRTIQLMQSLEEKKVIEKVAEARQHRPAEWHIHLEKAPRKIPFDEWRELYGRSVSGMPRGATTSAPLENGSGVQSGDTEVAPGVQSRDSKEPSDVQSRAPGVQSGNSGVQSRDSRGATASAPEPSDEPSNEPSDEPAAKGDQSSSRTSPPELSPSELPDDITASCLLLLKKVKGFPRDQGKVALAIAELRKEFPLADAVGICRDYEWKHRRGGMETKNHLNRLRAFFRSSQKRAEKNLEADKVRPIRSGAQANGSANGASGDASHYTEGYEYLFEGGRG